MGVCQPSKHYWTKAANGGGGFETLGLPPSCVYVLEFVLHCFGVAQLLNFLGSHIDTVAHMHTKKHVCECNL